MELTKNNIYLANNRIMHSSLTHPISIMPKALTLKKYFNFNII